MDSVLRVILTRSSIRKDTLLGTLSVVSDFYKEHEAGLEGHASSPALTLLDILDDALRVRIRVSPSTITTIVEVSFPRRHLDCDSDSL